jgi:hypothetical protein
VIRNKQANAPRTSPSRGVLFSHLNSVERQADKLDIPFTPEQLQQLADGPPADAETAAAAERRAHGRVAMNRLVKITLKRDGAAHQTMDAWFQDLSVDGLGLILPVSLKLGDRIGIELSTPRQMMEYVVCRCQRRGDKLYSIGCTKLQAGKKPKSETAAKPAA